MTNEPTYTAAEIKKMALKLDIEDYRILIEVVDDELDLYSQEDLQILCEASMIIFTRALLLGSLKFMR